MKSKVIVNAGPHNRHNCPVVIANPALQSNWPSFLLNAEGRSIPIQVLNSGDIALILDELSPGEHNLAAMYDAPGSDPVMSIVHNQDDSLTVLQDGDVVTAYHFSNSLARPYLHPLNAPGKLCVTRSYPMVSIPGESTDHHHHKSVWIAHGDINGVDNWSEEAGHGRTVNSTICITDQGPVLTRFEAVSKWQSADGTPQLTEQLITTFWKGTSDEQIIDFDITLCADQSTGSVRFGDTKEGGILSVRMASPLDARRGGSISNVYGGINEKECWGKPSQWCSYAGSLFDKECGIAVLDDPNNFRAPTTWHVRDYGLMTANPFGYAAFTDGRMNGDFLLPAGDRLHFRYRLIAHTIPNLKDSISSRFINYAFPPGVTLVE